MDLSNPILAGYAHLAEADLPPDPVAEHMGSGDHLNSQQFGAQIQTVQPRPGEIPAIHQNPRGWYGETEQKDDDR